MARVRGSVTVSALPRQWFEGFVTEVYEMLETARPADGALVTEIGAIEGVRLVGGRHLAPGARYRLDGGPDADGDWTGELVVRDWRRDGETCVEITGSDGDGTASGALSFQSAVRPRTCITTGTYKGSGRLRQMSWEGRADFEQWWTQVSGGGTKRGRPPLGARLSHPLVSVKLAVVPEPVDDDRWAIGVTLVIRGRSWGRPVVALAFLAGGFALRRALKEELEHFRRDWEDNVPGMVGEDPLYAVARFLGTY
ncbi:hypothetical protein [Actinomadura sp. WMMA1423]|uniref:hypothetical protein n=1 Tax=Actinomadura sp. WMMA1423 TaxID=2591108 RepID=UPI0011466ACE|nr:hypothetical protein [Actinomadura sp. WMMA1423]